MQATARFWDKTAEKYAKARIRDEEAYREKLKITQGYFTPDSEVFEFACGTGTTAIEHAPHVKSILAVDISPKMLDIARHKADEAEVDNVRFETGTIEDFDAPEGCYDVVMGHSILHLLENPGAVISKVFKMLKPGGAFVTSTVCLGDRFSLWRVLIPVFQLIGLAPYVNYLSRAELERLFTDAGFEIDFQWPPRKKQAAFIIGKKPHSG